MATPNLGVAFILHMNFIIHNPSVLGAGRSQSKDCGGPAPRTKGLCIIKFKHKMDATPSFGVSMISKESSNPQLNLGLLEKYIISSLHCIAHFLVCK